MRAQIRESLFVERMVAALSAAFGVLATLLAALGLYGVMSLRGLPAHARDRHPHRAGRRAPRRAADGAARRGRARRRSGVALGLPGGYGLGRLIESQLFGLTRAIRSPSRSATATLLVAGLLAGYIPAARATRVDPMVALRA